MRIGAEASQFHLLALTRLDCQGVGIYPLIRRNVGGFGGISEDVEDCGLVDDRQEGHCRNNLLEDVPNLRLDLGFWFGWFRLWRA